MLSFGALHRKQVNSRVSPRTALLIDASALNSVGSTNLQESGTVFLFDEPTIPKAPTGLQAIPTGTNTAQYSWVDNSNVETGYVIERTADNVNFSVIATVGSNVTSYFDSAGLTTGTNYWVRVKANNGFGDSAYTATVNFVTAAFSNSYPNIPSLHRVTPISSLELDIMESGRLRGVDLSIDGAYSIEITHNLITTAQRFSLREFYETYQDLVVVVDPKDGNLYNCKFDGEPDYLINLSGRATVRVSLKGNVQ